MGKHSTYVVVFLWVADQMVPQNRFSRPERDGRKGKAGGKSQGLVMECPVASISCVVVMGEKRYRVVTGCKVYINSSGVGRKDQAGWQAGDE